MSLLKGARIAVRQCMNIKPNEKVLILTDKKMHNSIPLALYRESLEITDNVDIKIIKTPKHDGEEPNKKIADLMKKYDVIFITTSKSLTHTKAVRNASKKVRIASMPNVTKFSFEKGGLTANYNKVDKLCKIMLRHVKKAKNARITSKNGTNLELKLGKHKWIDDSGICHKKGCGPINLPSGEVATAPDEGKANGILVIDKYGEYGDNIKITVKNGYAIEIQGSPELKKEVNKLGKKARNIAELGIGTNPKAKVIGNVLEDEKVFGTVHIALGNNKFAGGRVNIPFHVDGIILKPTLQIGRKTIIKNGKWLIKK